MTDEPNEDADTTEELAALGVIEFVVPEGMMPVLMQTGDGPTVLAGWTDGKPGSMPGLLREIADTLESIERARAASQN